MALQTELLEIFLTTMPLSPAALQRDAGTSAHNQGEMNPRDLVTHRLQLLS
jgi:hypothetical protein